MGGLETARSGVCPGTSGKGSRERRRWRLRGSMDTCDAPQKITWHERKVFFSDSRSGRFQASSALLERLKENAISSRDFIIDASGVNLTACLFAHGSHHLSVLVCHVLFFLGNGDGI